MFFLKEHWVSFGAGSNDYHSSEGGTDVKDVLKYLQAGMWYENTHDFYMWQSQVLLMSLGFVVYSQISLWSQCK